jgi:hypothetical protein
MYHVAGLCHQKSESDQFCLLEEELMASDSEESLIDSSPDRGIEVSVCACHVNIVIEMMMMMMMMMFRFQSGRHSLFQEMKRKFYRQFQVPHVKWVHCASSGCSWQRQPA